MPESGRGLPPHAPRAHTLRPCSCPYLRHRPRSHGSHQSRSRRPSSQNPSLLMLPPSLSSGSPLHRHSAAFHRRASAAGASHGGKHCRRLSLLLFPVSSHAQSLSVTTVPCLAIVRLSPAPAPHPKSLNTFPISFSLFSAFPRAKSSPERRFRPTPTSSTAAAIAQLAAGVQRRKPEPPAFPRHSI
jgi:hypothetical protein